MDADTLGLDVDGDDVVSNDTWTGIDEGIVLYSSSGKEMVWDNDFRQWLEDVNYRRMVIFMGTCKGPDSNDTSSCFGGGFIDDLSAPRRIIISCTNETYDGCKPNPLHLFKN